MPLKPLERAQKPGFFQNVSPKSFRTHAFQLKASEVEATVLVTLLAARLKPLRFASILKVNCLRRGITERKRVATATVLAGMGVVKPKAATHQVF